MPELDRSIRADSHNLTEQLFLTAPPSVSTVCTSTAVPQCCCCVSSTRSRGLGNGSSRSNHVAHRPTRRMPHSNLCLWSVNTKQASPANGMREATTTMVQGASPGLKICRPSRRQAGRHGRLLLPAVQSERARALAICTVILATLPSPLSTTPLTTRSAASARHGSAVRQ
jgi:hypothetical protein